MENLREATGSLESMAGSLQTNVETLSKRADSTLTAFESMAGSIDREITVTSKDARSLIASLKETAGNLNGATSELEEIGRAHVCTPVTNAHIVCRLLPEKKNTQIITMKKIVHTSTIHI